MKTKPLHHWPEKIGVSPSLSSQFHQQLESFNSEIRFNHPTLIAMDPPTGSLYHTLWASEAPTSINSWNRRQFDESWVAASASDEPSLKGAISRREIGYHLHSDRFIPSRRYTNFQGYRSSLLGHNKRINGFKSTAQRDYERILLSAMSNIPPGCLDGDAIVSRILSIQRGIDGAAEMPLLDIRGCKITHPSTRAFCAENGKFCSMDWNSEGTIALGNMIGFDFFSLRKSNRPAYTHCLENDMIYSVAWCQRVGQDHLLALGTFDGDVIVIDTNSETEIWRRKVCKAGILRLQWTPRCITATSGSSVYILDFSGNSMVTKIDPPGGRDLGLANWNDDNTVFATGAFVSHQIHLYDASMMSTSSSSKSSPRISINHAGKNIILNSTIDWCPFRRGILACARKRKGVDLYDTNSGFLSSTIESKFITSAIHFSRSSKELCTNEVIPLSSNPKDNQFQNQMSLYRYGQSNGMVLANRFTAGTNSDGVINMMSGCKQTDMVATLSATSQFVVKFWNVFNSSKSPPAVEDDDLRWRQMSQSFLHQPPILR
jgi:hypothetical protein